MHTLPAGIMMMAGINPRAREVRPPRAYRMAAKGKRGEIWLYGTIGSSWWDESISATRFKDDLKALGAVDDIDLHIFSEGGSVFDGHAMHTLLVQHQARVTVHVEGLAASAASVVAMAGDEIRIGAGSFMMIHNAWTIAMGDAVELRKTADLLEAINGTMAAIYKARTDNTDAQVKAWMDAETWFTGAEAVKHGFADILVEQQQAAASVADPSRFRNLPAALRPRRAGALAEIEKLRAGLK